MHSSFKSKLIRRRGNLKLVFARGSNNLATYFKYGPDMSVKCNKFAILFSDHWSNIPPPLTKLQHFPKLGG